MRVFLATILFLSAAIAVQAQADKPTLYHPEEDAAKALTATIKEANAAGKHVLVQIGGNWCGWCLLFNKFTTEDARIDSLIKANYIVYHLNYSQENKNEALLAKFGFPQRFGFPVFIVLDGKGKQLHTQNSSYLEEGKGYNKDKVVGFFKDWAPAAINPVTYKKS